jgi:hypothetical protein
MAPLKQDDAQRFFQRLDPGAHARLRDTKRGSCVPEVQMLSNRQRPDKGNQRYSTARNSYAVRDVPCAPHITTISLGIYSNPRTGCGT